MKILRSIKEEDYGLITGAKLIQIMRTPPKPVKKKSSLNVWLSNRLVPRGGFKCRTTN